MFTKCLMLSIIGEQEQSTNAPVYDVLSLLYPCNVANAKSLLPLLLVGLELFKN